MSVDVALAGDRQFVSWSDRNYTLRLQNVGAYSGGDEANRGF